MKEWFKDWFSSEEYLDVYQHRDTDDAQKLLELIIKVTRLNKNASILDAACGAGRHSINLALRGFAVTGFDLSKSLLKKAKSDSALQKIEVDLFCADIRKICLQKKFDLILNLFTSFGYFTSDDENFRFAKTAYNLLNEKSYYVLDYLNSDYVIKNLVPETINETGNKRVVELRRIENGRVVKEILIQNGTTKDTYLESVQLYSKEKIISEFEKIGFTIEKFFGDYNGSEFNENTSHRLILFFKR
ncbi:MAG: class I SAM-dependent methyltransferase [Ignavibacteriales bacterium]|nr:class I SAM-dependent methyltransferase [Ignavibacteriales bacterium]